MKPEGLHISFAETVLSKLHCNWIIQRQRWFLNQQNTELHQRISIVLWVVFSAETLQKVENAMAYQECWKTNLRANGQACNTLAIPSKTVWQKRKRMKSQTYENQGTSLPIYFSRLNDYHCHGNNWNMKFTDKCKLTMKI